MKRDEEFRQKVEQIKDVAVDFVESKLMKLIETENTAAIIFYLKTQAKHRGYRESDPREGDSTVKIEIVAADADTKQALDDFE